MTRRKALRKELSRLRYERQELIRLVGCSEVYGDDYVTEHDIIKIKEKIQEVEREYERVNEIKGMTFPLFEENKVIGYWVYKHGIFTTKIPLFSRPNWFRRLMMKLCFDITYKPV